MPDPIHDSPPGRVRSPAPCAAAFVLPQRRRGGARGLPAPDLRRHRRRLRPAGEDHRARHGLLVSPPSSAARRPAARHAGGGRRHGHRPRVARSSRSRASRRAGGRRSEPRHDGGGALRAAGGVPHRPRRKNSTCLRQRRFPGDGLCTATYCRFRLGRCGVPPGAEARRAGCWCWRSRARRALGTCCSRPTCAAPCRCSPGWSRARPPRRCCGATTGTRSRPACHPRRCCRRWPTRGFPTWKGTWTGHLLRVPCARRV